VSDAFDLADFPVHLGLGARVERLERFDGTGEWYGRYGAAHAADGAEGRLVTLHTFGAPWGTWEMHPRGEELVVCVSGRLTLHQEVDGTTVTVTLEPGQAIVNPLGVWHTADVSEPTTALFVTAGLGTEIRAR
jgi:mannose-6-phosphate isomerase-like protein (cupin superfamily)